MPNLSVLRVISYNANRIAANRADEAIAELATTVLAGAIQCFQEVSSWPSKEEFKNSTITSYSVYRKAESYVAIAVPPMWTPFVTGWDSTDFSAWMFLFTEIAILNLYLPDSAKSDELYVSAVQQVKELVRSGIFTGRSLVIVGDLNVELPPEIPNFTGV